MKLSNIPFPDISRLLFIIYCFSQIEVEPTLSEISLLIILISEFEEYREQDN